MKQNQFHGGKSKNASEFLKFSHEMLKIAGMVDACGVHFVAL